VKILFIHNQYQVRGGEDSVLENEIKLLQNNGHEVKLYSVSNHSIRSIFDKIKVFINVNYSNEQKARISNFIKEYKPDIVHVHNFFPQITPSVFYACSENNIPVVNTLHNFRLICPSALLMHNNKIYENSLKSNAYSTIFDKVYKNSYLGTFAVARMIEYHKKHKTWNKKVDKFIALTNFAKSKFVEFGLPESKIYVKPNFLNTKYSLESNVQKRQGALFVGRLSEEKGLNTLLNAWDKISINLKIIGGGPLEELVKKNRNKNIQYLGFLDQERICQEMRKASFLIFPSIWYEGFPMVIIESFANGLPIISSDIGSMSEIIKNNYNGLHFKAGDSNDLIDKIKLLISDENKCNQMSNNAYDDFKEHYTDQTNYELLIKLYKNIINDKKTKDS